MWHGETVLRLIVWLHSCCLLLISAVPATLAALCLSNFWHVCLNWKHWPHWYVDLQWTAIIERDTQKERTLLYREKYKNMHSTFDFIKDKFLKSKRIAGCRQKFYEFTSCKSCQCADNSILWNHQMHHQYCLLNDWKQGLTGVLHSHNRFKDSSIHQQQQKKRSL